jgi:hypothetical protein
MPAWMQRLATFILFIVSGLCIGVIFAEIKWLHFWEYLFILDRESRSGGYEFAGLLMLLPWMIPAGLCL